MKTIIIVFLLLYPITGNTAVYHPADTNKDWQISLEEFNAYNTAWRQGNEWPDSVNPIPNTYVARGGYLYKKGKCYHEKTGNAPMNWDSDRDCDRTVDVEDACPDDPNKIDPGICGCGQTEDCPLTNSIGMKFVYIEPGTFMMGSPTNESGRNSNETQHQVTLTKGYYMQTTEVTQGQWKAVMNNTPSYFRGCGDNCPVEYVTWNDVQEFITALNQKEKTDVYRLPTEAEWEYAARAGTTSAYSFGNDSTQLSKYGNFCDSKCTYSWSNDNQNDHYKNTAPVKSYMPNAWGLYDMHGNVWEWCQDWYGSYPDISVTDPGGPSSGSNRVKRGGSWYSNAQSCRSADRYNYSPGYRDYDIGLRLSRTL
jgi:formylglycine-generating enzyme required for sulfatase activity